MDIIIPITGRRASGKDTIAQMGIEHYGCTASVALSDWFKKVLSDHFKIPLADFYSPKKDAELETPIIIRRGDIARMLSKTSQLASKHVDVRYQKLSVAKWEGRECRSLRELMIWWADEVITKNFGETVHNAITAEAISKIERKHAGEENAFDVIFVTDARQFGQSSWFKANFKHVYPIKITRPLGTLDQTFPEKATEEFPPEYFFATIVNEENPGASKEENLAVLKEKVGEVIGKIRVDLKRSLPPRVRRQQQFIQPPAVQTEQPQEKKETNA